MSRYTIIGEAIKSATSVKLGDLFKVCTTTNGVTTCTYPIRYKENITNQQYPNFHIIQVNTNTTPQQTFIESAINNDLRRVQLDYLINIQYRVAEDTEQITNLRQQLDAVGLKLLTEFDTIQLGKPVYVKNCRYEIVDGVLQFFFNVTIFATLEQQNEVLMDDLTLEENIEEE